MFFVGQTFLFTFILKPFVRSKVGAPAHRGPGLWSNIFRFQDGEHRDFRFIAVPAQKHQHRTTPGQRSVIHKSIAVFCYSDLLNKYTYDV